MVLLRIRRLHVYANRSGLGDAVGEATGAGLGMDEPDGLGAGEAGSETKASATMTAGANIAPEVQRSALFPPRGIRSNIGV